MFYTYRQNNSGGAFDIDPERSLSVFVIIEADTPEQADTIAESKGIYFDGCSTGQDCECCGDRWHFASEYNSADVPSLYGEDVTSPDYASRYSGARYAKGNPAGYIHYADGRIVEVKG